MHRNESGNRKTFSKLNNAGLSLVELVITMAILSVVGGVLISFLQAGTTSYDKADKEVDIQYDAQVLLNQIGNYVMDANAGFKTEGNVFYIYSQNNSGMESEELSWKEEEQTLYYTKKQSAGDTETILVETTPLAKNVSAFQVDLKELESKQKIKAEITLQSEEKNYSAEVTWNVRNADLYDKTKKDAEEGDGEFPDYKYVDSVVVSSERTILRPGEEQTFFAQVIGSSNPSQRVTWSIEGEVTSEDTFIDEGGVLHVGEDESVQKLKVVARSMHDTTVTGSLQVQISDSQIRIEPEEVWLGVTGGTQDPDSCGVGEVEFTAELSEKNQSELSALSWTCSENAYQTSLDEQTDELKKTLKLSTTESKGSIWVQAMAQDNAGNKVISNKVQIHVVTITSTKSSLIGTWDDTKEDYALVRFYGLEDYQEGDIQVASSFEEIRKNLGKCSFYIYDSKEVLIIDTLQKNPDGSWQCLVAFHPKFSIWDLIFPNVESQNTCIGIYEAGKLNPGTDANGDTYNYGFSVYKIGLTR